MRTTAQWLTPIDAYGFIEFITKALASAQAFDCSKSGSLHIVCRVYCICDHGNLGELAELLRGANEPLVDVSNEWGLQSD